MEDDNKWMVVNYKLSMGKKKNIEKDFSSIPQGKWVEIQKLNLSKMNRDCKQPP
jgi:hypothetical protein